MNRFGASASGPFFEGVLGGEAAALDALRAFARALGMNEVAGEVCVRPGRSIP